MKKIIVIVSGAFATIAIIISILWIAAFNGAVRRDALVVESRGNIHAALSGRYEKVATYIDAIESANATVLGYLETITDAREAFADAIASSNAAAADTSAETLEATFITLMSYLESNPESYNTVGLYSGFMGEFSAATNMVTTSIVNYNSAVTDYNTHIKTFPNNIFVGSRTPYEAYALTYYNQPLPTFE